MRFLLWTLTPIAPWLSALAALVILAFALGFAQPARASPPDNADPTLAPWFQSLHQPGTGVSCCSMTDCRPVDYRTNAQGYEAFINNQWLPVPPERVLDHVVNLTGRAIVCYMPSMGILCFVRAPET